MPSVPDTGQNPVIIEVKNLSQVFPGNITAVNNISFSVYAGEIFGFLGPNGAGKSTTIAVLTTLLKPTGGQVLIAGYNTVKQADRVRAVLGYVSQDLAVDDSLTGRENLILQAGFYHIPRHEIRQRCDEVLQLVGLEEHAGRLVETYSGGMRKRLDIAAGLIHRPQILFLDEPTLGLDIQTRQQIWHYITGLREKYNMTIFLTTHYMEEADSLCNRIAIIDRGEIKTIGRPAQLKREVGGELVKIRFTGGENNNTAENIAAARHVIRKLPTVKSINPDQDHETQVIVSSDGEALVPLIFEALQPLQVKINSVVVKKPTLDDVYLSFTGRNLRDEATDKNHALQSMIRMRRIRS
jgi:ABC-2 type transport system ATP-binding protein